MTVVCVMTLSNLQVMAQSYTTLWKQVSDAQAKDLPQTELKALDAIAKKAQGERSYGHLLKAQLRRAAVQTQIAPDSIDAELDRVKNSLKRAEDGGNRVLAAVYQSVLGRIYRDAFSDPAQKALSEEYYRKSMESVELLAKQLSKGYEPALVDGSDSQIFGGDLLHVLGMEAGDYKTLHDWYLARGNRRAACLCALNLLRSSEVQEFRSSDNASSIRKSKYLLALDSLITEYQDLKECGELAIARYQFMDQAEDATAEEKMNYINYALQRTEPSDAAVVLGVDWRRNPTAEHASARGSETVGELSATHDDRLAPQPHGRHRAEPLGRPRLRPTEETHRQRRHTANGDATLSRPARI